jgi:hypothetical protein
MALPVPRTPTDEYLAAVVERLDRVADLLVNVLDRLPGPAGDDVPGGPGMAGTTSEVGVAVSTAEVREPAGTEATFVTEPAPAKPIKAAKVAKKTAAKAAPVPVKET